MKFYYYTFLILFSIILTNCKPTYYFDDRQTVGKLENNHLIWTMDSINLKKEWAKVWQAQYDTLQDYRFALHSRILKNKTHYFLTLSSPKIKCSMAKYLVTKDNRFYFFKNTTNKTADNEIAFSIFLTCTGTNTDCEPNLVDWDNTIGWAIGKERMCKKGCQTSQILIQE